MNITALLADSAQTDPTGKVHALGLGWSLTVTPTPPMALLLFIELSVGEHLLERYTVTGKLFDSNGEQQLTKHSQPVGFKAEMHSDQVTAGLSRQVGGVDVPEKVITVIPIPPGIALKPARYEWVVSIDVPDVADVKVSFAVVPALASDSV
ncbi:hypothetical protein ACFYV7_25445 [Nocardia suismassiliense]|uniref:Uncharacterized protein n=1 Tax=Nocardia suismassiliense TaxID=2077092 RepID=A0ABW6QYD5_9NOCA